MNWNWLPELAYARELWLYELIELLNTALSKWDQKLEIYGGDPARTDWSLFRLLRLNIENDWSDMLAWLIKNSQHGHFAEALFKIDRNDSKDFALPTKVDRELSTRSKDGNARRADLLITFGTEPSATFHIQMEVKINDPNLEKTRETAEMIASEYKNPQHWYDFLLIRYSNRHLWENVTKKDPQSKKIRPIYWRDVAIALRKALWIQKENHAWNTWALTLCGAIETKILNLACLPAKEMTSLSYKNKLAAETIIQRVLWLIDERLRILNDGANNGS